MPTEPHINPAGANWGEDDRLEPPGVQTRTILLLGAGVLVFVAVSLALLMAFFRVMVGGAYDPPPPKTFPDPRLETNIEPRSMPSVTPGAATAPRAFPQQSPASAQELDRAMAQVAAKGARAYDALDPAPTPQAPAGHAEPAQPQRAQGRP